MTENEREFLIDLITETVYGRSEGNYHLDITLDELKLASEDIVNTIQSLYNFE